MDQIIFCCFCPGFEGEGCHSRQRFCYPQATDEQLLDVGNRIVKSVRGAGASVEWSGDPGETIVIKVLVQPA